MKRTTRRLLITAAVIVGVVVLLSIAVRLVLTRDVLMELVVPRLESAVGAEISVEDIGVRFPFGFGVDIRGLAFEKTMPQGENLAVGAERLVAKASLLSLIKKKPVIQSVEISGGSIEISGGVKASEVNAGGIGASLSMKPAGGAYRITADLTASSVGLSAAGTGPFTLSDLRFEGEMTLDADYRSLRIERGEAGWGDLLSFDISGDLGELGGARTVDLRVVSERIELAPIMERAQAMGIVPGAPGGAGTEMPVKLTKGSIGLDCTVTGSLQEPSTIAVEGKAGMKDVAVDHALLLRPATASGDIEFDRDGVRTEKVTVAYGSSRADIGFAVTLAGRTKIDALRATCSATLALEDIVPPATMETLGMRGGGTMAAKIDFEGTPADAKALFPAAGVQVPVPQREEAWKRSRLSGEIEFGGIDIAGPASQFRVSGLGGTARFAKGDLESIKASFSLNGSPYSFAGSVERLMPALIEMKGVLGGPNAAPIADLGPVFQKLATRSLVSARIEGRSFDVTVFQKKGAGPGAQPQEGAAPGREEGTVPAANPLALLALKGSAFTAHLDTIKTAKAVFTEVDAQGSIVAGKLRADPVTLQYAGGTGRAVLEADLRKPGNIKSRVDLALDQVQASAALSAMHPLGRLLGGAFSFEADASFESGPGLNPLLTLNGKGSALSNSGTVDLSSFLSPITQSGLIDLSHLERIDFRDWRGNFVMSNGRFVTDNWTIKSNRGDWSIKGSFGVDGTIDYRAHLVVPPAVQQSMKDLSKYRDLVELFRDESGNLVLDLEIGGTSASPRVSLDMSAAKAKAAEKATESLIDKAKDWLKK